MVIWRPFIQRDWMDEMGSLLGEMQNMFSYPHVQKREHPPVNIWIGNDEIVLTSELPGVKPEEISISVKDDTLVLNGKLPEGEEGVKYYRQERKKGPYRRVFRLPFKVQEDKIEASYEKGILEIKMPRAEKDKPRQIAVQIKS